MIGSLHFYLQQVMHRLPSLASQSWLLLLDTHLAMSEIWVTEL